MAESPADAVRPAVLETPHGNLSLPAFLPDATRAVIRTLDSADVAACGIGGVVVNTFHLLTHPGSSIISAFGGVHEFMGWPHVILSDSGGFQVYSLLTQDPKLGSVSSKGFTYRTARGGPKRILTPDKCIRKQFDLGVDAMVVLDHCTHPTAPADEQRRGVENTVRWARQCRDEFDRLCVERGRRPALFAVVQGGADPELRIECAERLVEIGFDGYGYGGWPVDEDGVLLETVGLLAGELPADSLRWAAGIGNPEDVVRAAAFGYDVFDCVLPTRDARHGRLYAFSAPPDMISLRGGEFCRRIYPLDDEHARATGPVDEWCDCPCCASYSLGYLHHLFRIRDALAFRLATMHNLRFYARLMEALQGAGMRGPAEDEDE